MVARYCEGGLLCVWSFVCDGLLCCLVFEMDTYVVIAGYICCVMCIMSICLCYVCEVLV